MSTAASAPPAVLPAAKIARLEADLRALGRVIVAFSGGGDSTYLLAVAHGVLGDDALGVTGVSPSLAEREYDFARRFCAARGIPFRMVRTAELARPGYRENAPDRCYHCKSELFDQLAALAAAEGYRAVCDGFIADDLRDWRPGRQAGVERAVRSPLADAGFTKEDVRAAARARDLPTWDKPAMACLASRIPYGAEVTPDKLRRIEQAEAALGALGFVVCRVRHHGDIARVELAPVDFERALAQREALVAALKAAGYRYVTLDLQGFRSGSMNEALGEEGRRRKDEGRSEELPTSDF